MRKGKISVVVGGNYGSEAKGQYIEKLTRHKLCGKVDIGVRTGAPNAGHTVNYKGKYYAMQQIPVTFVDSECILVLGAGSLISPHVFCKEYNLIQELFPGRKIIVDIRASILDESCVEAEKGMHARMGSTGEGCGEALIRKIRRNGSIQSAADYFSGNDYKYVLLIDTVTFLNQAYDAGNHILLEGTQGSGLSLIHGETPYTTSRDTNAANWLMEAGLSPSLNVDVHMVFRTYPIRVAGNSGPLARELTWPEFLYDSKVPIVPSYLQKLEEEIGKATKKFHIGEIIENDIVGEAIKNLPEEISFVLEQYMEKTTVTKKFRRIAKYCEVDVERACMLNRPRYIALTFANYTDPTQCKSICNSTPKDLIKMSVSKVRDTFTQATGDIIDHLSQFGLVHYLGISKAQAIYVK